MDISLEDKKTDINEPCVICMEERATVCNGYCSVHCKEKCNEIMNKTAVFPTMDMIYPSLALAGEVGELCNSIKKLMRDYGLKEGDRYDDIVNKISNIENTEKRHRGFKLLWNVQEEMGDCVWYIDALSRVFRLDLKKIIEINELKLKGRGNSV